MYLLLQEKRLEIFDKILQAAIDPNYIRKKSFFIDRPGVPLRHLLINPSTAFCVQKIRK